VPDNQGVLREVSWRDLFPWLLIFRTFGVATSVPLLLLATVGAALTPVGWRLAETLFVAEEDVRDDLPFAQFVADSGRWPGTAAASPAPDQGQGTLSIREIGLPSADAIPAVFRRFVAPVQSLLTRTLSVTKVAYYVFGSLWLLLVWGFVGGAIARTAALRLGREERIGLGAALRFACQRWFGYAASPLFPLALLLLTSLPMYLLGLLLRWDWGVLTAGVMWWLLLLCGLSSAVLLLGLLCGWPLMWGTISCERQGDTFEAFSRSFSYAFRCPLHYLFYAALGTACGALGWLLVYYFAEAVIYLTDWPAALAAGTERWSEIERVRDDPALAQGTLWYAGLLLAFFRGLVRATVTGFCYSFFWCLATAVYLLLRRDVDHTEFDEVYVENENLAYQLPALEPAASTATSPDPAPPPAE
jgi:hypothetical protein